MAKILTNWDLSGNQLLNARIHNSNTAPQNPTEGLMYYDTDSKSFMIYVNGAWVNHTTLTASRISDFSDAVTAFKLNEMTAPDGSVSMNSQKITNLADGVDATDAVSMGQLNAVTDMISTDTTLADNSDAYLPTQKAIKTYVDNKVSGLRWKDPAVVASTENVNVLTLNAGDVIDGYTLLENDRILLKDQTDASENGLYIVGADEGDLVRTADADEPAEVSQMAVWVMKGTVNATSAYVVSGDYPVVIGTSDVHFTQFSGLGQIGDGEGLSKTGNVLNINTDNDTITIDGDALKITNAVMNRITDVEFLLADTVTGTGLRMDGAYIADLDSNFLTTTTSIIDALSTLDNELNSIGSAVAGDARSALSVSDTTSVDMSYNATTGEFSSAVLVDNTTVEVGVDGVKVKDSGIGSTQLADGSVTAVKLGADVAGTGLALDMTTNAINVQADNSTIQVNGGNALEVILGSVTSGHLSDDAVTASKINSDVAGTGLAQNVDGSLEVVVGNGLEVTSGETTVTVNAQSDVMSNEGYPSELNPTGYIQLDPNTTNFGDYVNLPYCNSTQNANLFNELTGFTVGNGNEITNATDADVVDVTVSGFTGAEEHLNGLYKGIIALEGHAYVFIVSVSNGTVYQSLLGNGTLLNAFPQTDIIISKTTGSGSGGIATKLDGTTLSVGANGLKVADALVQRITDLENINVDENVRDVVGALTADSSVVDFTYVDNGDATSTLSATIKVDSIDKTMIASDVAGNGLGQNADGSLEINAGNGLEVTAGGAVLIDTITPTWGISLDCWSNDNTNYLVQIQLTPEDLVPAGIIPRAFSELSLFDGNSSQQALPDITNSVFDLEISGITNPDALWIAGTHTFVAVHTYLDMTSLYAVKFDNGNWYIDNNLVTEEIGTWLDGATFTYYEYNSVTPSSVVVKLDGTTLAVGVDGLKVATDGITGNEIADSAITFSHLADATVEDSVEGLTDSDTALPTSKAVQSYVGTYVDGFRFAGDIGDGVLTEIPVTHNLGTIDIIVQIYEKATGSMVFADVTLTSTSVATISFSVAPSNNQYRVVILAV